MGLSMLFVTGQCTPMVLRDELHKIKSGSGNVVVLVQNIFLGILWSGCSWTMGTRLGLGDLATPILWTGSATEAHRWV
jgi:hypothetical protein